MQFETLCIGEGGKIKHLKVYSLALILLLIMIIIIMMLMVIIMMITIIMIMMMNKRAMVKGNIFIGTDDSFCYIKTFPRLVTL